MQYRCARTPGATYFFTLVTHQRQRLFQEPESIALLRQAFHRVKQKHPFQIESIVVLPDHLHCIWTLPLEDANFSMRRQLIEGQFSRWCPDRYKQARSVSRMAL